MKDWGDLKFPKGFTRKWIIIGIFRFSLYFNKMHTGTMGYCKKDILGFQSTDSYLKDLFYINV